MVPYCQKLPDSHPFAVGGRGSQCARIHGAIRTADQQWLRSYLALSVVVLDAGVRGAHQTVARIVSYGRSLLRHPCYYSSINQLSHDLWVPAWSSFRTAVKLTKLYSGE